MCTKGQLPLDNACGGRNRQSARLAKAWKWKSTGDECLRRTDDGELEHTDRYMGVMSEVHHCAGERIIFNRRPTNAEEFCY